MTTPRRCGGFAALVLVLVSTATDVVPVAGQTTRAIERGSRVRITAPSLGLREAIGTIREATHEALVVQFEFPRRVATVDRSKIVTMQVSIRQERRVLKGLRTGLLVGAASGLVLGLASGDDDNGFFEISAEEKAVVGAIILGLAGGVVGLIAGTAQHDVWSSDAPSNVNLSILPWVREHGAGFHIALTLRPH